MQTRYISMIFLLGLVVSSIGNGMIAKYDMGYALATLFGFGTGWHSMGFIICIAKNLKELRVPKPSNRMR